MPWMRPVMALRPQVQFGIAPPGGEAAYTKALLNRFEQPTLVGLTGTSIAGWDVDVDPTAIIVQPGVSETIDITVNVPLSPTLPFDVEGVIAISVGPTPYTARAYMVTIVHRTPFGDMPAGHWADGPVQDLAAKGAISGYPDGTFRPDANVTRAQVAKMVVGAMAWEITTPQQPTFSDVPAGHWAYAYVETAAAHGIINGYADGTFRPDANVTRAQVAKMVSLARGWAMELPATGTFTDAGPADWYFAYAEMTAAAGVMSGYPDGTFRPNAPATRAQVAKILGLGTLSEPTQ
jgi:hypothetical protein